MSLNPIAALKTLSARERGECLAAAHDLADQAGRIILPYFRKALKIDNKAGRGFDPVTIADKAAEKVMRKALALRYPSHGIIGEEFANRSGDGRFNWILDPIDGTRAFIMGSPLWGTLIGLADGDEMIVGMMDQPFTRERFWAKQPGRGAYLRGPDGKAKRLKTRTCGKLSDAILTCTALDLFTTPHEQAAFDAVSRQVRMTRFGGDCYAYCLLAAGHVDLVIEAGLKSVDIAPLIPIITAAGGIVTSWTGGSALAGGQVIAAGDAKVHAAALKVLSNSRTHTITV